MSADSQVLRCTQSSSGTPPFPSLTKRGLTVQAGSEDSEGESTVPRLRQLVAEMEEKDEH